ncbi:hypothetical protein ABPG75_000928 [Micractinium tetrahymenae]
MGALAATKARSSARLRLLAGAACVLAVCFLRSTGYLEAAAHAQHGEAVPLFPPDWVKARLGGQQSAPPPLRVAHIMLSDRYKLIYVKCTKTAGSSLVRAFTDTLCDCQEGAPCGCLGFVNYTDPAAVQHAIDSWDDYFVFPFSRNVLRRAVSQYQYLTQLFDPACPVLSWDQYCHDPYLLADMCGTRTPKPSPRAGRPCCLPSPAHHYEHASPQAHCLTTEDGCTAVDWVGRVESVEEDLAALVELLNSRPGVPKLKMPHPGQLGHVNVNTGTCQQAEAGSSGGGGILAAPRSWLSRRRLEAAVHPAGAQQSSASAAPAPPPGQGGPSGHIKLPPEEWEPRNGTLNLCNKNDMFRGRYRHCLDALAEFYAEDLCLLHGQ